MSTENHVDRAIQVLTLGAGFVSLIVYALIYWL